MIRFENAQFEAAFGTFSQIPQSTLPEVAFAGRSNVGKSSLLNKLFNRKSLARVSSVPGKTITINFYKLGEYRMVDLPGYGYAKVAHGEKRRWAEMMEGYFQSDRNLKLVVQLIDMRHAPSKDDMVMLDFLKQSGYPFIIVYTKSDKLNKTERTKRLAAFEEELADYSDILKIPFSATKGEGVDEIKKALSDVLEQE